MENKFGLQKLGSEIILGTLIALLSIFTGIASYQGAMADSDQNKNEIAGMQALTDANSEYLTANQFIVYDYSLFDSWALDNDGERSEYYQANFSQELTDAIAANPDEPFSDAYYEAMYASANEKFAEADSNFAFAGAYDERGDGLQLVMLITAVGLAFAAWASLLSEQSKMRILFSALGIIALVSGVIAYLQVPGI